MRHNAGISAQNLGQNQYLTCNSLGFSFAKRIVTSISFYKKLGLRFAYINLNVKESDLSPISSWFM